MLDADRSDVVEAEYRAQAEIGQAALRRLALLQKAQGDLLTFAQVTSADPAAPDDLSRSRYQAFRHHRLISSTLMAVEMGLYTRVIISMPPRHGKSELTSRKYIPWSMGRNPRQQIIFGTYNEEFALDFGRDVRAVMTNPVYQQVFPGVKLGSGSAASDRLQTIQGGIVFFVGRGGSVTGRGANKLVLDDMIKDRDEANSRPMRDRTWSWFTDVAMSRLMDSFSCVIIILTRWHEDDVVGRLTDPKNPCYDPEIAKQWTVINIPALAEEDDLLDRKVGEPLWPERFTREYLEDMRKLNPVSFSAIWQGKPNPAEGSYFNSGCIHPYRRHELPGNLRLYGASDLAVSTMERNDKTCMGLAGVDEAGDLWILPDLFWRRATTTQTVDAMLSYFSRGPLLWWAEKDQIFRSIEPFLRQRMMEAGTYCAIHQVPSIKDKEQRAQPIQGRMAMGKVRLPIFASWYGDAVEELYAFSAGLRDDFVDFLSLLGRGLALQNRASVRSRRESTYGAGTFGALKYQTALRNRPPAKHQGF
jgi:predicted phage terminase large subunit-like protein